MASMHIVLVGTSSLRNLGRALLGASGEEWAVSVRQHLGARYSLEELRGAFRVCSNPRPGSHEDVECGRLVSGSSTAARAACDALLLEPYSLSAELNAMRPWIEAFERGDEDALGRVVLLATDTGAGQAAARVIKCYFSSLRGGRVDVEVRVVPGLGRPEPLYKGLVKLLYEVRRLARSAPEGDCVLLNLTGGFKPEGAYALIGGYADAHAAYYIHETFRHTVVIPLPRLKSLLESRSTAAKRVEGGAYYPLDPSSREARCIRAVLEPPGLARPYKPPKGPEGVWVDASIAELVLEE